MQIRVEKMSTETQTSATGAKFRKDLDREAVRLAMEGEWDRAAEVNRAILELFADDVEAMNRLTKALIELGSFDEAISVVDRVSQVAPYNNIARKNRARLDQVRTSVPASTRHVRRAGRAPQLFIGESGKTASTTLRHTPRRLTEAQVPPGDPVQLVIEHHGISVYSDDGEFLGQIEPRLGHRLGRLIESGNTYEAVIIGFHDYGISIMIHETYRHSSLQHVASFPTRVSSLPAQARLDDNVEGRVVVDDDADDDENEGVIDEDELQSAWSESE